MDSISKTVGLDILKFLQPQVKHIFQVTGTASGLLQALNNGNINIAVTMLYTEMPPNIRMYPLIEEEFLCICPKSWPETELEELCKQRNYIAYTQNTPTGIQTLNWLKWQNFSPTIQFEMDNADEILKLISCGYGWTLTTPLFITTIPAFSNLLKIIRIKKRKERRKIVLLCKNDEFSVFIKIWRLRFVRYWKRNWSRSFTTNWIWMIICHHRYAHEHNCSQIQYLLLAYSGPSSQLARPLRARSGRLSSISKDVIFCPD